MLEDIQLRVAGIADCYCVAKVHKSIFADHLLGRLPVWLIQRYYVCLCKVGALMIVAENNDGQGVGFVLGGQSGILNRGKKAFLMRWWWAFGTCVLMDRIAWRLFEHTYLRRASSAETGGKSSYSMRLLSIGVNKDMQGSGVAAALLSYFEAILKTDNSISGYGLSVHNDNARAIRFYQKNGFDVEAITEMSTYLGKRFE